MGMKARKKPLLRTIVEIGRDTSRYGGLNIGLDLYNRDTRHGHVDWSGGEYLCAEGIAALGVSASDLVERSGSKKKVRITITEVK